ncbi:MAG: helix-turn-helix domain-containing protein [Acidimicrobiales bacterium]
MSDPAAVFEVAEPDREKLAALVAGGDDRPVAVRTDAGEIELPAPAGRAVLLLLEELAAGASVHLVATDAELTTQQAAELLGLSRTYVIRLIESGKLPAHLVGTHRRLSAADVLAYKAHRAARLAAVDAIAEADADLAIPYR